MSTSDKLSEIKIELINRYGLLIGGLDLRNTLGYKAASTFNRAKRLNLIGVHVFKLPNRRGSFALSADVAHWLSCVSKTE